MCFKSGCEKKLYYPEASVLWKPGAWDLLALLPKKYLTLVLCIVVFDLETVITNRIRRTILIIIITRKLLNPFSDNKND